MAPADARSARSELDCAGHQRRRLDRTSDQRHVTPCGPRRTCRARGLGGREPAPLTPSDADRQFAATAYGDPPWSRLLGTTIELVDLLDEPLPERMLEIEDSSIGQWKW